MPSFGTIAVIWLVFGFCYGTILIQSPDWKEICANDYWKIVFTKIGADYTAWAISHPGLSEELKEQKLKELQSLEINNPANIEKCLQHIKRFSLLTLLFSTIFGFANLLVLLFSILRTKKSAH